MRIPRPNTGISFSTTFLNQFNWSILMNCLKFMALATTVAFTLTACGGSDTPAAGGAGAGAGAGGVPTATTGTLTANQTSAAAFVKAVNDGVALLNKADAASDVPGFTAGAVATTLNCNLFDPAGTGTYTFDSNATSANLAGTNITIQYNNCAFGGASFNGGMTLTYDTYVAANNFSFTQTYTNFTVGGIGLAGTQTANGTTRCTVTPTDTTCSTTIDGAQVSNVRLTNSGTTTTVQSANVRANLASANGYVDCVYNGWSFNSATGRAGAGTVTITGLGNTTATVSTSATGYTVVVNINGVSTTYTVPFA
jgi:hypothetical protein